MGPADTPTQREPPNAHRASALRMGGGPTAKSFQGADTDLLQGTLDLLILQTLRWGTQHGYGIGQALRAGSDDTLRVETGSLYPALHRLEKRGLVAAERKTSDNNQRAKYYRLTIRAHPLPGRGGTRRAAGTPGSTARPPHRHGSRGASDRPRPSGGPRCRAAGVVRAHDERP